MIKKLGFLTILASVIIALPNVAFCQSIDHKATADQCLKEGRPTQAIVEYNEALLTDPSSTAVYFDLAIAYYSLRNTEKAEFALTKVVELDPNDIEALYNLACIKLYRRDIKAATLHFQEAKRRCAVTSEFAPLIQNGLDFIENLKNFDPQSQNALFLLLLQALPAQGLNRATI